MEGIGRGGAGAGAEARLGAWGRSGSGASGPSSGVVSTGGACVAAAAFERGGSSPACADNGVDPPTVTPPGEGLRAALVAMRADHARLREERPEMGGGALRLLRDALWHKTFRALVSYRLYRAARRGQALARLAAPALALWHRHVCLAAGMEIAWAAGIGPGCRILHGFGVVILPCARIGANATLCMGAGVGARARPGPDGRHHSPGVVEDGGFVGPYSMVWARLGRGGVLASHSALLRDSPPGAVMAGAPAREIRRRSGNAD